MSVLRSHAGHVVAIAAAGFALAGCGGSTASNQGGDANSGVVQSNVARDTSPAVASGSVDELASDNTRFAFDLYHEIASAPGNLFYSPYSISLALAMTYAGARGETAQQMAHALDYSLPASELHPAFDKLDLKLESRAHDGKGLKLNVADSLWGERTMQFNAPFLDTLAADYGAGMHVIDFINQPDVARAAINGWVADQTDDKIENLLGPGAITDLTRLVLVNAIYFNAAWDTAFDPNATQPEAFTRPDGSTVQADEMHESTTLGYAEGSNYQAVEIPYTGNETSMVVVLPKPGAFQAVESELSGDFATSLFSALRTDQVDLSLPKFEIHGATIDLSQALVKLGMTDAFQYGVADFSGMAGTAGDLYITGVLHQAFVSVDEAGTEAAAATAVVVGTALGIGTPTQTETVNVDRPFFVLIRDLPTNSVLFAGRVTDPTS
jgi:serine protease inhibitor